VRIFYHFVKSTASPIKVKAFANYKVVVEFVLGKEGLWKAPWTFRPGHFLGVECGSWVCLDFDSVLGSKTENLVLYWSG
jgi:hypothetical protein